MRHRRRTSTQSMTIKKSAEKKRSHFPTKTNTFARFFKFVGVLIVIGGILYLGYDYLLPVIERKLPALKGLTSKETSARQPDETKPELPAEDKMTIEKKEEQVEETSTFLPSIQVEILNGCGEQGIAKSLADKLMALKYDVVNTGNYLKKGKPFFEVKKTRIINQVDSKQTREKARKLAQQIGLAEERIESIPNANPIADITIIIGQDFKSLKIFKGKSE